MNEVASWSRPWRHMKSARRRTPGANPDRVSTRQRTGAGERRSSFERELVSVVHASRRGQGSCPGKADAADHPSLIPDGRSACGGPELERSSLATGVGSIGAGCGPGKGCDSGARGQAAVGGRGLGPVPGEAETSSPPNSTAQSVTTTRLGLDDPPTTLDSKSSLCSSTSTSA